MARTVLGSPSRTATELREVTTGSLGPVMAPAQLQQRLRNRRSPAYLEAATRLDAGGHLQDKAALAALIQSISDEFPDLGVHERPLGIVAECYLGAPYEVHVCDLAGGILEHYERHRQLPPLFHRARSLATHPAYAFIEIYADKIRAVAPDGSVSVL